MVGSASNPWTTRYSATPCACPHIELHSSPQARSGLAWILACTQGLTQTHHLCLLIQHWNMSERLAGPTCGHMQPTMLSDKTQPDWYRKMILINLLICGRCVLLFLKDLEHNLHRHRLLGSCSHCLTILNTTFTATVSLAIASCQRELQFSVSIFITHLTVLGTSTPNS